MRVYSEPKERDKKYTYRPGAYAILTSGDQILITHQAYPEPEFQLPGGGIDPGESPTAALHREVMEETGWRISRPQRLGAYRRFVFMPEYDLWAEKVAHIYLAKPVRSYGSPTEAGHTAVWMDCAVALQALTAEGDRKVLLRYLAGGFSHAPL